MYIECFIPLRSFENKVTNSRMPITSWLTCIRGTW